MLRDLLLSRIFSLSWTDFFLSGDFDLDLDLEDLDLLLDLLLDLDLDLLLLLRLDLDLDFDLDRDLLDLLLLLPPFFDFSLSSKSIFLIFRRLLSRSE